MLPLKSQCQDDFSPKGLFPQLKLPGNWGSSSSGHLCPCASLLCCPVPPARPFRGQNPLLGLSQEYKKGMGVSRVRRMSCPGAPRPVGEQASAPPGGWRAEQAGLVQLPSVPGEDHLRPPGSPGRDAQIINQVNRGTRRVVVQERTAGF